VESGGPRGLSRVFRGHDASLVLGRRVWDSRGRPTVEAEVHLASGIIGRAIAPAGASRGSREAIDLRDGGDVLGGFDVARAIANVNGDITRVLQGMDAREQSGLPLWRYLGYRAREDFFLPLPEVQIFGGGAHAGRRVDVQDFMVIAVGAADYAQALEWTAEVYRAAGLLMNEAGLLAGVADEGGWWPAFDSNEAALDFLLRAIERAGYTPGQDVAISLDIAATDFGRQGEYTLARDGRRIDSDGLAEMLLGWLARYPVVAIEDPLAEDDAEGLRKFTAAAGDKVEVVADDFICTNAGRIAVAAAQGACNTALVKPNQAGTLSETRAALDAARAAGWESIVSARSGETEDVTIVHLAVGWGAKQLKVGSFARSERMAKWNEGLRLAEALGQAGGRLPPRDSFPWGGQMKILSRLPRE
jgi:enolase